MDRPTRECRTSRRMLSVAATGVLLTWAAALGAPPASATVPTCSGQPASIVGTPGNDTISGTAGDDVMVGLGGDDVIRGHGGSDIICGGDGNDVVHGSRVGGDIFGDAGNDTLYSRGRAGLTGGDGNDTLDATADGSSDLLPGPGDDLVIGSAPKAMRSSTGSTPLDRSTRTSRPGSRRTRNRHVGRYRRSDRWGLRRHADR